MKYICQVFCLLILCGCGSRVRYSSDVESALKSLDKVISHKELIEEQKENRIQRLRSSVDNAMSDFDRYYIYDNLFNEYFQYNIDSTIAYAHKKIELAKRSGDIVLIKDAVMDLAERYTMSGEYFFRIRIRVDG